MSVLIRRYLDQSVQPYELDFEYEEAGIAFDLLGADNGRNWFEQEEAGLAFGGVQTMEWLESFGYRTVTATGATTLSDTPALVNGMQAPVYESGMYLILFSTSTKVDDPNETISFQLRGDGTVIPNTTRYHYQESSVQNHYYPVFISFLAYLRTDFIDNLEVYGFTTASPATADVEDRTLTIIKLDDVTTSTTTPASDWRMAESGAADTTVSLTQEPVADTLISQRKAGDHLMLYSTTFYMNNGGFDETSTTSFSSTVDGKMGSVTVQQEGSLPLTGLTHALSWYHKDSQSDDAEVLFNTSDITRYAAHDSRSFIDLFLDQPDHLRVLDLTGDSTTSTSDQVAGNLSCTVTEAGDYVALGILNMQIVTGLNTNNAFMSIYANGSQVSGSELALGLDTSNTAAPLSFVTHGVATLAAGQNMQLQWRTASTTEVSFNWGYLLLIPATEIPATGVSPTGSNFYQMMY